MSSTAFAVVAEGLRKRYGDDQRARRLRPGGAGGHGVRAARAERRRARRRRCGSWPRCCGSTAGAPRWPGSTWRARPRRCATGSGSLGQHAAVDEMPQRPAEPGAVRPALPPRHGTAARRRADELLERFGLADAGGKPVKQYSGGMRRRLDLAASLILAPPVLFLDEPTTGLDPRGRNEVWEAVRALVAGGTTVLLTTQYLDEADQLADAIAVIDPGRVIAEGTPDQLKSSDRRRPARRRPAQARRAACRGGGRSAGWPRRGRGRTGTPAGSARRCGTGWPR